MASSTSSKLGFLTKEVWQEALQFNRGTLMPGRALRQIVGLGIAYGLAWAALGPQAAMAVLMGALMGGAVTMTGPSHFRTRLLVIMITALCVAMALTIGLSTTPLRGVVVATALSFLLSVIGNANPIARMVTMSTVSFVIVFAGLGVPHELWTTFPLAVLAGGLWQWLYLDFIWPIKPFQPEREQIASLYRELAHGTEAALQNDRVGLTLARSQALANVQQIAADRFHGKGAKEQKVLVFLLDRAYVIDAALTGLRREVLRLKDTPKAPDAEAVVSQVTELLYNLADHFQAGQAQPSERDWAQWRYLPGQAAAVSPGFGEAMNTVFLAVSQLEGGPPVQPVQAAPTPSFWQSLMRAVQDPQTLAFSAYYALSIGALLLLADWLKTAYDLPNAYWLVMTYSLMMSTNYRRLLTRGLARVIGTFGGVLLTAASLRLLGDTPQIRTLLLTLSVFFAFTGMNAGYAPLTFGFTVFTLAVTDTLGVVGTAWERLVLTVGGVLAAYFLYRLWPNWEMQALTGKLKTAAGELRELLEACRDWAAHDNGEMAASARRELLELGGAYSAASALLVGGRLSKQPGSVSPQELRSFMNELDTGAAAATTLYADLATGSRPRAELLAQLSSELARAEALCSRAQRWTGGGDQAEAES